MGIGKKSSASDSIWVCHATGNMYTLIDRIKNNINQGTTIYSDPRCVPPPPKC